MKKHFIAMKKFSFMYLLPVLMMLAVPFQVDADDFLRGDTNQDGNVNIADVTNLIDYLLSDTMPEDQAQPCDTNQDGMVNISDVTNLIDYLLNGIWEDDSTQPADGEVFTYYVDTIAINMVYVRGGLFWMGATAEQGEDYGSDEIPVSLVRLSGYYVGQTEVTQRLWIKVMGKNPSDFTGARRPVEDVSWNDCQEFLSRLNELTGMNFRLLSEAEWEFAARGGNKSQGYKYAGSDTIGDVAWYTDNSYGRHHDVATKAPNELGLYDMSGNVMEWCQDWYGSYTSGEKTNPTGPATGTKRVLRGGSGA